MCSVTMCSLTVLGDDVFSNDGFTDSSDWWCVHWLLWLQDVGAELSTCGPTCPQQFFIFLTWLNLKESTRRCINGLSVLRGPDEGPPLPPLSRRTPTLFMELSVTEPCRWIREDWNHADTRQRRRDAQNQTIGPMRMQEDSNRVFQRPDTDQIETWSTSVSLQPDSIRFRYNTNFF